MINLPKLAFLALLASSLPLCAVSAMNESSSPGAYFFSGNATAEQEAGAIPVPLPAVLAQISVDIPVHWNRIGVHVNDTKSAPWWHASLREAPEATIRGVLLVARRRKK